MPLFRTKKDIEYIKRVNRELIERVIGEKITYYPVSKQFTEDNFYGEARKKVLDPPVKIYCLVEWSDQETATNKFGQDVIYTLQIFILDDHLTRIGVEPREGDFIDYDGIKFEITEVTTPSLILGKELENIGKRLSARSVREGTFVIGSSASVEHSLPTHPDSDNAAEIHYGNVTFPRSGSFYT